MNISDLITRQEYDDFMQKVKQGEKAEYQKTVKVADGFISFRLYITNNEKFCSLQIGCNRRNNQGGCSIPIDRYAVTEFDYEQFAKKIEFHGTHYFPSDYTYFDEYAEQLSMF